MYYFIIDKDDYKAYVASETLPNLEIYNLISQEEYETEIERLINNNNIDENIDEINIT